MRSADRYNAFVDYAPVAVPRAARGCLRGKSFGVKDIYDVAGYPTGCGHPLKRKQSALATRSARCVQAVLDAGAEFAGKTHTDEIAYSLNGENHHFGTPSNPAAPDRIPGGSSSGSAVSVAGNLVDFAIGSDTGGSVRVPASYCGIWGYRPTHDIVAMDGAMPFAPSFDTVGWFARSPAMLRDVGRVLLPARRQAPPRRLMVVRDGFALLPGEVAARLTDAASAFRDLLPVEDVTLAGDGLEAWGLSFRIHQGYEIWRTHGPWITANQPEFGPGIKERFAWTSTITKDDFAQAARTRENVRRRVAETCGDDIGLLLPTVPGIAPLRGTPAGELEDFRNKAMQLLCIAGLAGVPQVSMPLASVSGCPVGLSVIGRAGSDLGLLDFVCGYSPRGE